MKKLKFGLQPGKIVSAFLLLLISTVSFGKVNIATLNDVFKELQQNPSSASIQKKYFDAFPSNWMDFYTTYNYDKSKQNLYDQAEKQIKAFGLLKTIAQDTYVDRLFTLVLGGSYDADAPSYLRSLIVNKVESDPKAFFSYLTKKTPAKQMLFWQFFWENSCKDSSLQKRYDNLFKSMKTSFPKETETMRIAFNYFYGEMPLMDVFE